VTNFPVYLRFGEFVLHPHWIFETAAYSAGYYVYRHQRRRGDVIDSHARWWVIAAAVVGGFLGSRMLAAFEDPFSLPAHWNQPHLLLGGKTIVGGLIGGLIAVELVKRLRGIHD
jgi:phosphatidylglycerol:prolipoprotein diacylglycerol transferase